MMQDYFSKVLDAVSYIRQKVNGIPEIGIILGSGLDKFANEVTDRVEIPYDEIPHFPFSGVAGHHNKLVIGKIYQKNVIVMLGRVHYYEGYEMDEVTFPIKVMSLLGVSQLVLTNAAGGLNKEFKCGDIMLIKDHINISGLTPLRGENISELGTRFPNMKECYSPRLIQLAKEQFKLMETENAKAEKYMAKEKNSFSVKKGVTPTIDKNLQEEYQKLLDEDTELIKLNLREGIYAFMPGPQYETNAEIRMLSILGADAVGMSTVPEVISATHSGIEVLGISCITDECYAQDSITHDEVLSVANRASNTFVAFLMKLIKAM